MRQVGDRRRSHVMTASIQNDLVRLLLTFWCRASKVRSEKRSGTHSEEATIESNYSANMIDRMHVTTKIYVLCDLSSRLRGRNDENI